MKKMTTALLTTLILGSLCAAAQNAGNLVVNGTSNKWKVPKKKQPGNLVIALFTLPAFRMTQ